MSTNSFQKICRLCLFQCEKYINVFHEKGLNLKLVDKIDYIFNFKINVEDEYCLICLECVDKVTNFFNFYTKVLDNQKCFLFTNETTTVSCQQSENIIIKIETFCDAKQEQNTQKDTDVVREEENYVELSSETNKWSQEENSKDEYEIIDNYDEDEIIEEETENNEVKQNSKERQAKRQIANGNLKKKLQLKSKTKETNDDQLPDHLKERMTKERGDAQIREFVQLKCEICEKRPVFETFKKMQLHYETKHNCRGYVICCDKKIFRKDRLMNHITNHINPDAFKCPICGKQRKSKILLKIHMKQHLPVEERPFQCDKCNQRFVLKSQLTNHEASHYTADQKKYVCEVCGKAFALKFVMTKHKLTHTKEKNFVCEICAKSFATNSNLQTHMTHHTEGPQPRVQCPYCKSWYKNEGTLRTHLRRHKDQRQHICVTCGKQCTTKSSLAAHIRYVHLKVKEFECSICKKQLRRKLELTEHMARHTGQVLYKCPFCTKTFTSSSNYFSHRKNRHPSEFANISNKDNFSEEQNQFNQKSEKDEDQEQLNEELQSL